MKIGLSYMVFEGEELLPFAIKPIRNSVDFISVIYQTTSYFGQKCNDQLLSNLQKIKEIDSLVHYEPDLKLHVKENELRLRNIGLNLSKKANCTHHIALDVDEFFTEDHINYVKNNMEEYDSSLVYYKNYYKDPRWLIQPSQDQCVTFLHSVNTEYANIKEYPYRIEITRRLKDIGKCRVFSYDEFCLHHMTYVRNDIRKKIENSSNWIKKDKEKFISNFDKYQLGQRLCIPPDFMNRYTVLVDDIFKIKE